MFHYVANIVSFAASDSLDGNGFIQWTLISNLKRKYPLIES